MNEMNERYFIGIVVIVYYCDCTAKFNFASHLGSFPFLMLLCSSVLLSAYSSLRINIDSYAVLLTKGYNLFMDR